MSENLAAKSDGRGAAVALGLLALLFGLAGAIPIYGLIGSVAAVVLGTFVRPMAKQRGSAAGAVCAVLGIYLGAVRILLTLVVAFLPTNLLNSPEPHRVEVPKHQSNPARPSDAPKPNP